MDKESLLIYLDPSIFELSKKTKGAMHIKRLSILGLFLSLLLFFPIHVFSGLSSGTQIATFDGAICIENLIIGSKISGYNPPDASLPDVAVENIRVKEAQGLYIITTDKGVIQASGDQLFYEIVSQAFIQAEKLEAGDLLLTKNIEPLRCLNVEYQNTLTKVYDLTLQEPHLFFSSEAQVLTHNHPVLILTIPWAAPAAVAALVFVGAVALDAYVEKLKNSSNRRDRMDSRNLKEGRQYYEIPSGGGQMPDPNDPKKKKDDDGEKEKHSEESIIRRRKCYENQSTSQLKKSYSSMRQRALEHEEKLRNFIKNPDAYDNKGHLKRASSLDERQSRIVERTRELQKQIRSFNLDMEIIDQLLQLK